MVKRENISLGRLERVALRNIWLREAGDFTPWLAQPHNLKLLSDAIGIELECEAQEKDVGPFRADILCKNTIDDAWVLIENQLERTDHGHLGQLLTYAAGLDAVTIIWIAESITEGHRAALDWLNEITNERFNFFGLEIQAWKIGDSQVAPKFNIVSRPNDWTRTVQKSAQKAGELSETKETQLQFWISFKEYIAAKSRIRCQKPYPQNWMYHSIGRTGMRLVSIASTWDSEAETYGSPELRAEFQLDDKHSKAHFAALETQKEEIERDMGHALTWHNPPNARACRIYVRHSANFLDHNKWPECHEWLRENLENLYRVFRPRVMELGARPEVAPNDNV